MTVKEELEMLAKDYEECADEAMKLRVESAATGEARAWQSVAYRIRHAAKGMQE